MKGLLALALLAVIPVNVEALPNISFDTGNWTYDKGVSVSHTPNGTTVCITGNNNAYIKALLTVPRAMLPTKQYYFIVESWLKDIVAKPESYEAPKLKVNGDKTGSSQASNMQMSLPEVWMPAALQVSTSQFMSDPALVFEISIQQTTGQFCARAPRLSMYAPAPSYVYPFPPPFSNVVSINISSGKRKPFTNTLLSVNSQLHALERYNITYSSPQTQAMLQWLQLPQIRFPGGTIGNFYSWRNDSCYPLNSDTCESHRNCADPNLRLDFEGFSKAIATTNASTVLMFNVIDDSPAENVARLQSRTAALGVDKIDWLELGNENMFSGQSCGHVNPKGTKTPHPEDYISYTKEVAAALRASGTKVPPIAANIVAWGSWLPNASDPWNLPVTSESAYDGFVMHPYVNIDCAVFTSATAGLMLEASSVLRGYLSLYAKHVGPQRPLLLTEFGILGIPNGTYLQALSETSMYMQMVDLFAREDIHLVQAGIHILLSGPGSNSLFTYDSAKQQIVATATGVVWWKLVRVLVDSTLLGAEVSSPPLPGGTPAVDVQVVQSDTGGTQLLVVNKLGVDADLRVTIDGQRRSACNVQVFSQPALNWQMWELDQVEELWVQQPNPQNVSITIPPTSIATIHLCSQW